MLYILPPPSAPSPPSPWESIVMCSGQNKLTENRSFKKFGLRPLGRSKTCGRYRINKKDSGGIEEEDNTTRTCKSLSECYFAGKGTALMLGSNERLRSMDCRRSSDVSNEDPSGPPSGTSGSDIQQHLQSMFYLLRPEETLKMAVKLESLRAGRTRYLVVVSRPSKLRESNDEPTSPPMANITNTTATASQQPPTTPLSTQQQNAQRSTISSSMTKSSTSILTATTTTTPAPSPSHLVSSMSMSLNVSPTSTATKSKNQQHQQQQQQCSCQVATTNVVDNNTNDNDNNKNINNELSISSNNKLMNNNLNNCDKKVIVTNTMSCAKCEKLTTAAPLYNNNLHQHNDKFTIKSDNSSDSICSNDPEECCLLGIDCNEKTTVGLVLKVLADTSIRLDGDGGFSVNVCARQHIFKPVSVQAMWSALQTLHKVSSKASEHNFFSGGTSHEWVSYYESRIESDRSCLNEWHAMDSLESRRPPSPDVARNKPTERRETERTIRTALKEIMMSVDLDEVTSKYIRGRLEKQLDMDLGEYKSFIDEEMLIILGQMDAPTEIFEHVYLGSEWNASNLEELQRNGVGHILNVTREIDNFFPGMFDYFNVRVYDDEKTDLLKHWDNTFKYISRAKMEGSKVLVHCKMGISRSASVVIAYAMKAHNWNFEQALRHVKDKRNCIKPNKSFLTQLETYQGILDAMKNKEKLQRSKSETNLKSTKDSRFAPTPIIQMQLGLLSAGGVTGVGDVGGYKSMTRSTVREMKKAGRKRPKSWSPDIRRTQTCKVAIAAKPLSQSLEYLGSTMVRSGDKESKTVLMPCKNGQNYSVSQNQIVHLQENKSSPSLTTIVPSVKLIVSELESNERKTKDNKDDRRLLNNFNLLCDQTNNNSVNDNNNHNFNTISAVISETPTSVGGERTAGETKEIWDPGDIGEQKMSQNQTVWTSTAQIIHESLNPTGDPKNELAKSGVVTLRSVELAKTSPQTRANQPALGVHPIPAVADLRSSSATSIDPNVSRQSSWSSVDSAVVLVESRDMPSRHSSWGSGDNRMTPSRNSSWGSYDIRNFKQPPLTSTTTTTYTANVTTLPPNSRIVDCSQPQLLQAELDETHKPVPPNVTTLPDESQTGIFPYDKDVPWHVGTVKRTRQRIEQRNQTLGGTENLDTIQRNLKLFETCEPLHKPPHHCCVAQSRCNSEEVLADSTNLASKTYSRLSASAPEPFSLMQFIGGEGCCCKPSQQQRRGQFQSHFAVGDAGNLQGIKRKTETGQLSGMVKNLKMNFEAKAIESTSSSGESISGSGTQKKGRSLPSSPVAMHPEVIGTPPLVRGSTVDSASLRDTKPVEHVEGIENVQQEDITVRGLVDKYEITKMRSNSMNAKKSSNVTRQRPRSVFETKYASNTLPSSHHTKPLMINHATVILKHDRDRPPVPPPTVRNTIQFPITGSGCVVSGLVGGGAASKTALSCKKGVQQHGKTHPLARLGNLTTKQRLNAAYNTM